MVKINWKTQLQKKRLKLHKIQWTIAVHCALCLSKWVCVVDQISINGFKTSASASVLVSPKESPSFLQIFFSNRRMIFPDLVFGSELQIWKANHVQWNFLRCNKVSSKNYNTEQCVKCRCRTVRPDVPLIVWFMTIFLKYTLYQPINWPPFVTVLHCHIVPYYNFCIL